jgi:hypothetical protein
MLEIDVMTAHAMCIRVSDVAHHVVAFNRGEPRVKKKKITAVDLDLEEIRVARAPS